MEDFSQVKSLGEFHQKKLDFCISKERIYPTKSKTNAIDFFSTPATCAYFLAECWLYFLDAKPQEYLCALKFLEESNLQVPDNRYVKESHQQTTLRYLELFPKNTMWQQHLLRHNVHASYILTIMIDVARNTENFTEDFIDKALHCSTPIAEYALWLAFFYFPLPKNIREKIALIHNEDLKPLQDKIGILYEDDMVVIEELYLNNDVESYFLSLYHLFSNEKTAEWPIIFVDSILSVPEYKAFFLHLLGNMLPCSLVNEHIRVVELLRCKDLDVKVLGLNRALKNPREEYIEVVLENIVELPKDYDETFCQNLLCLLAKIAKEDEIVVHILCDVLQQKQFCSITQKYLIRLIAQFGSQYTVTYDALQQLLVSAAQDTAAYALDTLGDLLVHNPQYYPFLTGTLAKQTTISIPENYRPRAIDWLVQIPTHDENFLKQILSCREIKLFLAASNKILNVTCVDTELQNIYLQAMRNFFWENKLDCDAVVSVFRAVAHIKPQLNAYDVHMMMQFLGEPNVDTWFLYTLAVTNTLVTKEIFINLCDEYSTGKTTDYLQHIRIKLCITHKIFSENPAQYTQDIIKENLQCNRDFYRQELYQQKTQWLAYPQNAIEYLQLLHDDVGLAAFIPQLDVDMQVLAIKALASVPITTEIWHIEEILHQHVGELREAFIVLSHMATRKDISVVANIQQQIYELLLQQDHVPKNILAWLQQQQITLALPEASTPFFNTKTIEKPASSPYIPFTPPSFTPVEFPLPQFLIFAKAPYPVLPDNMWIQLHEHSLSILKYPLLFDNKKVYGSLHTETNIANISIQHYETYSYNPHIIPGDRNRLDFIVVCPNDETQHILENCLQDLMEEYFAREINFFLVIDFNGSRYPKSNFTTTLASEYCLMVSTDRSIRNMFPDFTFFDTVEEAFIYGKDAAFTLEEKRAEYNKRQPKMDWMELEKERGITITTRGRAASSIDFLADDKDQQLPDFKKKAKKPSRRQRSIPSMPIGGGAPPPAAAPAPPPPPPPVGAPATAKAPPPSLSFGANFSSTLQRPRPTQEEAAYGGIGGFVREPELELGVQPQKPRASGEQIEPGTIEPQETPQRESAQQWIEEKPAIDLLKKIHDKVPRSEYLDNVEILPTKWFEKWLSDDAGHPGPIERLVAQSTMVMKSIQRFFGLRFIMLAHFGDVVVEAITSYVRGIFETWKNYKTIQKRLSIKNIDAQINMIEEDLLIARQQISRAFHFVGYNVYEGKTPEATFALKLMIDLRGHLDQMKRDLAFVNAQQIHKNIQNSVIDFFKSFIPNPMEIVLPIKDSFIIAFFMKYNRHEIEKMYVDLFVSYRVLLDSLIEENAASHLPKFTLQSYEERLWKNARQGYIPKNPSDVQECIEECKEKVQRLIQMTCNSHYLVSVSKWSKTDLINECKKHSQTIYPLLELEAERWTRKLAIKYMKKQRIKLSKQEQQQQIEEYKNFARRYKIAITLHRKFLQG